MKLQEMTMVAGDLSYNLSRYFNSAARSKSSFLHVGDIESIRVLNKGNEFLLDLDQVNCAYFYVKAENSIVEISVAYVDPEFRRQNIFAKFIWFLKRFYHTTEIVIGDVHSKDTIEALKKLSSRFNISWTKDGQKVKYNPEKVDDFYGVNKPTGWKIVLENDGDFSKWPKFFDEQKPDIKQHYDWLLE